jgi:hypothetical protein
MPSRGSAYLNLPPRSAPVQCRGRWVHVALDRNATDRAIALARTFGARVRALIPPEDLGPTGDLNDWLQVGASGQHYTRPPPGVPQPRRRPRNARCACRAAPRRQCCPLDRRRSAPARARRRAASAREVTRDVPFHRRGDQATDAAFLIEALEALVYKGKIEVHDRPVTLIGYDDTPACSTVRRSAPRSSSAASIYGRPRTISGSLGSRTASTLPTSASATAVSIRSGTCTWWKILS